MSETTDILTDILKVEAVPIIKAVAVAIYRLKHPDRPAPTDAEADAAYEAKFAASDATDTALSAEPDPTGNPV